MTGTEQIEKALKQRFDPTLLEVTDDSHKHAGHAGVRGATGITHLKIAISAEAVAGASRLEKHRAVSEVVHSMAPEIHSVSIELR